MKKEELMFSIILPVYNCEKLLARSIESVLAQSFQNYELIIADDGSEDGSGVIGQGYQSRFPEKIQYYKLSHSGQSAAINSVFPFCKGKYVATLDADDYYLKNHLQKNFEYLNKHAEVDLLIGKVKIIGDRMIVDLEKPGQMIDVEDCVIGGTFFVKNSVFEAVQGRPNVSFGTDYFFAKKVSEAGFNVERTDIRTYVYDRTLSGSMTKIAEKKMKRNKDELVSGKLTIEQTNILV